MCAKVINKPDMGKKDIEQGKTSKTNRSYPTFRENLSEYFSDYSQYTAIHGVRHLGKKNIGITEKIWWIITICVSIVLCSLLIKNTYEKWVNSPVIVSFAKTTTPIWKIPFPAITVCPETKAKQRVYNYTDMYHRFHETPENMTQDEVEEFETISLVCNNYLYTNGSKTIDYDSLNLFSTVGPKFDQLFWMCRWLNDNHTCHTLFMPILTDEGLCYTFNTLDREDLFTKHVSHNGTYFQHGIKSTHWSLENGYNINADTNSYPRRALAAGHRASFGVVLNLYEQDLDYICKSPVQGFKILIHNPVEVPTMSQQHFWATVGSNIVVSIIPEMMTTSNTLKDYDSKIRKCYFSHERQLKYFQVYTQRNCELECVTNYTLETCGCVAFHMPRNESTKICGTGSATCMENSQNKVAERELKFGDSNFENSANKRNDKRCNCMPSCTSLAYNVESSQAEFNIKKVFQAFKVDPSEFPGVLVTRVDFFFKQSQFITSERHELYGVADFLSHCGGLLGLFIGFSLLSLIEIFYWLSLRVVCNIRKYGYHFWSGSVELPKQISLTK